MKQLPGFEEEGKTGMVCLLKRSLHGLKQAATSWDDAIHTTLMQFQQSKADPCLYTKKENGDSHYLLIYVDDLIAASKNNITIDSIKATLNQHFGIEDLGEIKFYLGIHEHIQRGTFIWICRRKLGKRQAGQKIKQWLCVCSKWRCRQLGMQKTKLCGVIFKTEAEFIALSEACKEAFWLRRLLEDMD
ncbi:hypothetical protein Trydic_g20437 [Trypoxylus dichotomus]